MLLVGCTKVDTEKELPKFGVFTIGMERTKVLELFGEPIHAQEIIYDHALMDGPGEHFWRKVPVGSEVEIWQYRAIHEWIVGEGDRSGNILIYFIDGANKISGRSFSPDGVIY